MATTEQSQRITMTPAARRVLEAAERLFYERGIHAVGVDLIAAEAGVTKKTLYDRFGSKERIVVEYLAGRDERWRAFLAQYVDDHLDAAHATARARVLAVFDASRAWSAEQASKGCSMVNAHAEISDPSHPAHPVITGQKEWMLALFTGLAEDIASNAPDGALDAARLGRTLMLLHEGALVAHGLNVFPDPIAHAREQAEALLEPYEPYEPYRAAH
ncbi:TetR family transcriptional regulator [Streptomyces viridochromogenes]|uniref:TetR family transcriptional regulator n=1 Tax=Streptomyces viridochromogenes TaxID=1938 RepID=A0A0J8CCF6_STRVR|nr:TetR/AcrR family transcriptional regulator [Streptomyces viridochromogenes]KMS75525.1 TetR family transcriptional regulator [Streptomyces viridochromogenes]